MAFVLWLDKESLYGGDQFERIIRQAIAESSYFLALLSSCSIEKQGFVQKEIRIALERMEYFPEGERFIVPIRLEQCEPAFERLKGLHRIDLFQGYETGLKQILQLCMPREKP